MKATGWAPRALAALLFLGILVAWSPEFWAVTLVEAGAYGLCAVSIMRRLLRRKRMASGVVSLLLAAVAAWGWLQLASGLTIAPFETRKAALYWSADLAVFVAASDILSGARARAWFLRVLLWFGFGITVAATVQLATAGGRVFWLFPAEYAETFGPFVYKNQYAAFVELIFPLALCQALSSRRRSLLYLAVAAALFAAVVAAASRAGAILLAGELAVTAGLLWYRGWLPLQRVSLSLARLAVLSLAFIAAAGWENIWSRFHQTESYQVRTHLLSSSLAMIRDRPWTGFGLGTWGIVYPAYATFDNGLTANQAPNNWAEWTAEGGAGFALLLAAMASWSAARAGRRPWALGVTAVFLHSLVDYPLREPALGAVLFSLMGTLHTAGAGMQRRAIPARSYAALAAAPAMEPAPQPAD